ncbi:hypothetical protein ACFYO0_08580 [Streptomyces sp. NPDC006365]|uniref:hypothetical protein n=1 Tax=Streptomyces sp. NPDC006365 TaxID=3364744 RepID=UPI0036C05793
MDFDPDLRPIDDVFDALDEQAVVVPGIGTLHPGPSRGKDGDGPRAVSHRRPPQDRLG